MEKMPKFESVGNVDGEEKRKFAEKMGSIFEDQADKLSEDKKVKIETANYPKTAEQISVINFLNEETNLLMIDAGVEPFDVPLDNIYILPEREMKEWFHGDVGTYKNSAQAIGVNKDLRSNLLKFAATSFHEMLHMKSRHVWQLRKDGEKVNEREYRSGVRAFSTDVVNAEGLFHTHFSGLDEAIVAWQEKLTISKILDLPELAREKEKYFSEENQKKIKEIAEKDGISQDEITFVVDSNSYNSVGYRWQRAVLEYVCEEIAIDFPNDYLSKEEVFKNFLNANFNGNLLEIGRLVEKTFGKGSFRDLSGMRNKAEKQEINLILEKLKKNRRLVLSDRP